MKEEIELIVHVLESQVFCDAVQYQGKTVVPSYVLAYVQCRFHYKFAV